MDIALANEVIACLPKDRTQFNYYEDRYAAMLLERLVGEGMRVSDIKSTRFAKLLQRPAIRQIVARKGDGILTNMDLLAATPSCMEHFVLTLGLWGWKGRNAIWSQTSRHGVNLVLQMNFSRQHDQIYRKLVDPKGDQPYAVTVHPICMRGRNTLAWARLDLELDSGQALIEEIQNDWLREAMIDLKVAREELAASSDREPSAVPMPCYADVKALDVVHYAEQVLGVYRRIWAEAMLTAAIWFLWEEIGIHHIWYHDHETGARLKRIRWHKPPRSLYTDLPKRFCFLHTSEVPDFIIERAQKRLKQRMKTGKEHFWRLYL